MRLLILGGSVFLGRALVDAALARGHSVTLFNRGQTNPELYPQVEHLHGDRATGDLSALENQKWDATVDTCGYVPRIVRQSALKLAGQVGRYCFISSLSVYADESQPGGDEQRPVGTLPDESVEEVTGETYGPLKALCERAVEQELPGRTLIIRPGLIVGPYDRSDRFSYWVDRAARGGEVLAPGNSQRGVQFIDVRDLAKWIVRMLEGKASGVYNATGLALGMSMQTVLQTCASVAGNPVHFTWVSEEFLQLEGVGEWIDLPLWIAENNPENAGFYAHDCRKAFAAGLSLRPLEQTVSDTLAWLRTRLSDYIWRAGLKPTREAELLVKWQARGNDQ